MCTIVLAYKVHPTYPLVLVGNRDEFLDRPTAQAAWWDDEPDILAGRDLKGLGTWMGINKNGRIAALTNFRNGIEQNPDAISRGKLVSKYLQNSISTIDYTTLLSETSNRYNGFNLLYGEVNELYFNTNMPNVESQKVQKGIHAFSNGTWNEDWPKVRDVKRKARSWLGEDVFPLDQVFSDFKNTTIYSDTELPATNIPLEWERILSALYVDTETYGTCITTVLLVDNNNHVTFCERSHRNNDIGSRDVLFEFLIDKAC